MSTKSLERVLNDVREERARQDRKFGAQRQLDDGTWLKILVEEVGEVAEAMLSKDLVNLREELIQVAAVGVCAVEGLDGAQFAAAEPVVYLAGPIADCDDAEAREWRTFVKRYYPHCLDPLDRDFRGKEVGPAEVSFIVKGDKAEIDRSDVLLVWHPFPSVGTSMEILYAYERGKRIIVIEASDRSLSPWIRYHASEIVPNVETALELLGVRLPQAAASTPKQEAAS